MRATRRGSSGGLAGGLMAIIVAEFDAACKIEAGEENPLATRQARGGSEAEPARFHSIDSAFRIQCFHALLGQGIHGALVVAQGREDSLLTLEKDGDVGLEVFAATPFADTAHTEDHADAPAFTTYRTA